MLSFPSPSLLGQSGNVFAASHTHAATNTTASPILSFPSHARRNIAFVDAGLNDVESLIQGLENTQVVLLNRDQDGIAQITHVLATQQNLDSVQIFSHGLDGSLQLGDAVLNGGTLTGYASQLEQWRGALAEQADVMLYGCNLAAGDDGLALLSRISDLTGADVAASDDLTGQGGDWDLEVATGSIEAAVALTQTAQATYEGTLALLNNGDFEQNLNGWSPFTGTETVSTAESFSGTAALQLSAAGSGVNQTMDVLVGESYTFTGNAKSSSSGYTAVGINFFDENYNYLDGTSQDFSVGDWQAFQLERTAVAGSRYVQFWAYKDTAAGDFFVDNLVADADGVAPPPPPPPSGGTELLSNPGFENGLGNWSGFTGSEAATTAESFAGGRSLQLSDATSGTAQLIDTVVAGEAYTLSAYGKSSSTDYVGLGINFFDSNFNVLAGGVGEQITSTDWQQYQATTTAPTGASYIQVWTYKSDGTGDAFLDDISLTFGGTTPPPSNADPTITSNGGAGSATLSVAENSTAPIININATDQDGDTEGNGLTYALEGPDASQLSIDSNTGVLSFNTAPDFEAPTDSNGDNQYNVDVLVTDSQGAQDTQVLAINVIDEDETSPDITAPTASLNASDLTTGGGDTYTFTVTYTDESGIDNATLDSNDIQVVRADGLTQGATLVSAANGTGTYRITAPGGTWNATDNGTYSVQLLAGQVSDINGNTIAPTTLGSFQVAVNNGGSNNGADLIVNGSFEATVIGNDAYQLLNAASVPGWQSLNGELLEFWDSGHTGVTSADGSTHMELDAQGGGAPLDGIYQDIQTEAGKSYQLTFDMRSRGTNASSDDEAVVVEWNGVKLSNDGFNATTQGVWTTITTTVVGTGGSDRLLLRESSSPNASDGTGPLLDNISLRSGDVPTLPQQPNGTGFSRETLISGLDDPLAFTYADDGRIFVTEKAGRVKIVENGQVVSTFIDLNEEINSYWDRGLMGIALDPDFEANGWVYLSFSVDLEPNTPDRPDFNSAAGGRLIKVKASATNPNIADLSTRETILDGHQMVNATHAVGDVDFDNSGNLIFSWGDGGFSDTLRLGAQDPDSKQGKFFRVDPDTGFGIPENPFYDPANPDSVRSKVWALGVRNPWRWTVDRPTGDVYFGEVTDGGPEEANILRANITNPEQQLNFGWPYFEDTNRTRYGTVPNNFVYEDAYVALPHSGGYDAITGGAVYRGTLYPEIYDGRYFFANFGQNTLYTADADGNFNQFGNAGEYGSATDIQLAPDGSIQYLSLFDGALYRLEYDPSNNQALIPNAEASASVTAGTDPLTVDFIAVPD